MPRGSLAGRLEKPEALAVEQAARDDAGRVREKVDPSSQERLAGWVAGHHRELEAEFGAIAGLWAERGAVQNGVG